MDLKNKIVLITGASSGIGKAISQSLIKKGAKIIVFGINKPEFNCEFHKVNVSNENEISIAMKKIEQIDILINNAGVVHVAKLKDTSTKMLNDILDINFKGLFFMCKYAIPKLSKNACILNISSIAGIKNYEEYGIYCASKAAVISLTKTLALELSDKKIRVNAIAPGIIDTIIWKKMYGKDAKKELAAEAKTVPLKRPGTPEEIAHAAVFACENDYLNGEVIVVDGGETIQ